MHNRSRERRAGRSGRISALALALVAAACLPASALAAPSPTAVVIRAKTVHTMAGKPLQRGTVVVQHGKVTCVGTTCAAPAGAKIIGDHASGVLLPGLVEADTHAGIEEVSLEPASGDGTVGMVRNAAHVRAIDGVMLGSRVVAACLRGGVTTLVARPTGHALLSGQSAAFHAVGTTVDDALLMAPVAIHAHVGSHAAIPKGGIVQARSGQLAALRRAMSLAAEIASGARDPDAVRLRRDPAIAALTAVVKREVPLVVHAHRADAITAALRLAEERKLRLVIAGGGEAHLVGKRLARAGVPVICSPGIVAPYSFDTLRAVDDNAARLHRAGVTVALSTGSSHNARNLRWTAGWAVAAGLPREVALQGITATPARILGLPAGTGTIAVGARASLALFEGDPLTIRSRLKAVMVGGALSVNPQQR